MIRQVEYKIKALRNGAYLTEMRWNSAQAPSISCRASGALKTSFSATFLPAKAGEPEINWLRDELQPCIVIDGVETPLGIFRPTDTQAQRKSYVTSTAVTAYDRGWVVQTTKTETLLHLSAGDGYIDVIKRLLLTCGITLVLADASSAVLPADREDWQTGTSYLTIINQLLGEIGFNPLWFDADGLAHLQKYSAPSAAAIKRSYSVRHGLTLRPVAPGYTETTDIYNAPNVFVCICDNADRSAVLTATAENKCFGAKSILQRGMRIVQTEKVKQIADQTSLQAYADKLRDQSLMGTRELTFTVPAEAGHGVGDIISIEHPDVGGIYAETGWSYNLTAGAMMTIKAKRTVIL